MPVQLAYVGAIASQRERAARLVRDLDGSIIDLPWWPDTVEWTQLSRAFSEVRRPGKIPLLVEEAQQLPVLQVGCIVTATGTKRTDETATAVPTLAALRSVAASGEAVYLLLGVAYATAPWRISDLAITEVEWEPGGTCSRAEVSMTLTQVSNASLPRGPVPPRPARKPGQRR